MNVDRVLELGPMEQFGLLEIHDNLNELTSTEERLSDARDSLELGDACLQSTSRVSLKGEMAVDSLQLNFTTATLGCFFNNDDVDGTVSCKEFTLPEWLAGKYQDQVSVSSFDNDASYVGVNSDRVLDHSEDQNVDENAFIFDESFYGMKNRPVFDVVKQHFGYAESFLSSSEQLSDITDSWSARRNLGLGNVATQHADYVYFQKVHVVEHLRPESHLTGDSFLNIGSDHKLKNVPFDFPIIRNDIPSTSVDLSNNLPSLALVSNLIRTVDCNIDDTARHNKAFMSSNESEIRELIYSETLFTAETFMSNTDPQQKETCRCNLSFGSISTQSSNEVSVSRVNVSGSVVSSNLAGKLFYSDEWIYKNAFRRSNAHDTEYDVAGADPFFINLDDVLTFSKAIDIERSMTSNLSNVENLADLSLEDFGANLFRVDSNLEGLLDVFRARAELNLHPCAITGRLKDLHKRPAYLSELENDVNYYVRNENFADVHPVFLEETRRNIGVSNMALEDADNIGGTEGMPLGVANKKFHSTDCVIDTVFVEKGKFVLKSLDLTTEAGHDFLCVEKFDRDVPGIKNFKYRYKKIDKCDEEFFTGTFRSDGIYNVDQESHLRVKINDLTNTSLLDPFGNPVREDHVVADYFVPSCKFSYNKFVSIASNILREMEIPVKYFEGGLDNIEYFNRQF